MCLAVLCESFIMTVMSFYVRSMIEHIIVSPEKAWQIYGWGGADSSNFCWNGPIDLKPGM